MFMLCRSILCLPPTHTFRASVSAERPYFSSISAINIGHLERDSNTWSRLQVKGFACAFEEETAHSQVSSSFSTAWCDVLGGALNPFLRQQGVPVFARPAPLEPVVFVEVRFAAESQALDQADGGGIEHVGDGNDTVQTALIEEMLEQAQDGFMRIAKTLIGSRQGETDIRLLSILLHMEGDIADQRPGTLRTVFFEFDGDLVPFAGFTGRGLRHLSDELLSLFQTVGGVPALVFGYLRVGAVSREGMCVGFLEGAQE
jgi:hypothetical protein